MKHDEEWLDSQVCSDKGYGIVMRTMAKDYHEHMMSAEPKILYADVVKKQAMIKVLEALGDHKLTSLTVLDSLAETEEEILELLGLI